MPLPSICVFVSAFGPVPGVGRLAFLALLTVLRRARDRTAPRSFTEPGRLQGDSAVAVAPALGRCSN
jgi:hypothetical protein